MNTTVTRLLIGIALTAGVTYLFDPTSGRRRRDTFRIVERSTASVIGSSLSGLIPSNAKCHPR